MCLMVGLAAAMLSLQVAGGPEYAPLVRALLGIGSLAIGYLVGRALRPLAHWRPPVPEAPEAAAPPAEGLGPAWVRGFAAGFWALMGLTLAVTLLYDLLIRLPGLGAVVVPATLPILSLFLLALCGVLPLAMAREMVGRGEGLPRWALSAVAGGALSGGLGLFAALLPLMAAFRWLNPGTIGSLAGLLALTGVPVLALGTPLLAQRLRPSLSGPSWTALQALGALAGAWLLYWRLNGWMGAMGPIVVVPWLLLVCLLWGGSLGGLLAFAAAQRRAGRARAGSGEAPRASLFTLAAGALGLLLLGLAPAAAWLLFSLSRGPAAATAPPAGAIPAATQPGRLLLPGPALARPTAGATVSGPVWTFRWNRAPGTGPGDLYQFTLWPPGSRTPAAQFLVLGPQARIAAMPNSGRWPPGVWTWRVRVVKAGQGAGQWSEARPFTPVWK
jgi:hypothetical protein